MNTLINYILGYCKNILDKGVQVQPLPSLKLNTKPQEGPMEDQKTAYYEPNKKMVVLYTDGRKDKDILRSFAHELVHHEQNLKNTLKPEIQTDDTTSDADLNLLEKEAYLKGNISLRNYFDTLKKA